MRIGRAYLRQGKPVVFTGRGRAPIKGTPIGWTWRDFDEGLRLAVERLPEPPSEEAIEEARNWVVVQMHNTRLPIQPRISLWLRPGQRLTDTEELHAEVVAVWLTQHLTPAAPKTKTTKTAKKRAKRTTKKASSNGKN